MTIRRPAGPIRAAIAAILFCAAPGFAQEAQPAPQPFDTQRFDPQRFDLERFQLSQDQLARLRDTIAQDPAGTQDQPERDARGRELRRIDWLAAGQDLSTQIARRAQAGEFSAATASPRTAPPAQPQNVQPADLARPSLPILLPETENAFTGQDETERGLLLFPRDHAYTATYHYDGKMFEVSGSRVVAAEIDDPRAVRLWQALREADGLTFTGTETGLSAGFTRYGAAYDIQMHCADPQADPACRDPETVRSVARSLVIAGGSPDGTHLDPEAPR